jgi:hypothetical protein
MQVGVHCIRGNIPHQECRQCALNPLHPCAYTPDLLEKIRVDPHERSIQFSPTRILSCFRQSVLKGQVDYYTDVDNAYPLMRGNMLHAMMEMSRYPGAIGCLREHQFHTTVHTAYGDVPFESKPDLIVIKEAQDGVLKCKVVDYKTKTDVGHDLTAPIFNHIAQVNMYRWLVMRELPKECGWDVDVDELEIEYCAMAKPRRFTSAGPLVTRGKMTKRSPRQYADLPLEAIPVWELDAIEKAVVRRIELRLAPREALPEVLPPEEQWMCERCDVAKVCWDRYRDGEA